MTDLRTALRAEIELRQRRFDHFGRDLFGEPAWDILIDLALCHIEGRKAFIKEACIAAFGRNHTTAYRYIDALISAGLAVRFPDRADYRRHYLQITDEGFARVAASFQAPAAARAA